MSLGSSGVPHPNVFISASGSVDTTVLREALQSRGYTPFTLDEVPSSGRSVSELLREYMPQTDLFVAIIGDDPGNKNVFYELGFAQACNKRVLAVAPSGIMPLDDRIAYLRADPTNREAMEFGLDSVLFAKKRKTRDLTPAKQTVPIGDIADRLIEESRSATEAHLLESVVLTAVRFSGVTVHAGQFDSGGARFDLAVWSDDLEPWISNPLLIEVKDRIDGKRRLEETAFQMLGYLSSSSAKWGLLLCRTLNLSAQEASALRQLPPNLLLLTINDFLEGLRTQGFGEFIIRLRNERVHGRR